MISPIIARENIVSHTQALKAEGKKIVFTNGCFDILHVGHVRYLQAARELGDVLIVGLNTDASVKRLKGPDRPLNVEGERAELLVALGCVDYVTLFDEQTPETLIDLLQPHIHVKGGDYKIADLPEAKVVHRYGGEVVIMPLVADRSTTRLISRMHNTNT